MEISRRVGARCGLALGVAIREDLPRIEAALRRAARVRRRRDRRPPGRSARRLRHRLVHREPRRRRLSEARASRRDRLLIFGGIDTTRNQLGLALKTFIGHPDQWELLRRRPELAPKAVDEVMRVNPTVTWITREAAEDFESTTGRSPGGTTIHLYKRPAPTRASTRGRHFDITAERARHFGFGRGIHHCLGHFVAKLDMSEALPRREAAAPRASTASPASCRRAATPGRSTCPSASGWCPGVRALGGRGVEHRRELRVLA